MGACGVGWCSCTVRVVDGGMDVGEKEDGPERGADREKTCPAGPTTHRFPTYLGAVRPGPAGAETFWAGAALRNC